MAMSNFLILLLVIVGQVHQSYQIWPFTSWKPSLSGLFSSFSSDDLSALPSNSEIELIAPLPPGIFPEQPQFDDPLLGDQFHFSSVPLQPGQVPQVQVPRQDAPFAPENGVYGGEGTFIPGPSPSVGGFSSEQKRTGFLPRIRPPVMSQKFSPQQQAAPAPQRYVFPAEQPILIIQKPAPEAENVPNSMATRSSGPQAPAPNQQGPVGGWVYLSPVDKLGNPEQPIILETFVDNQQYGVKGTKKQNQQQQQQQKSGLKLPQILSWSLFRKQQQQQQQQSEIQKPIIQYVPGPISYGTGNTGISSANINIPPAAAKPIYIYRAGNPGNQQPIGNYQYISPVINQQPQQQQPKPQPQPVQIPPTKSVSNAAISSSQAWSSQEQPQPPSSLQVWIENNPPQSVGVSSPVSQSIGTGQTSSWSPSNTGTSSQQQYWTESQSPSRVQFPKQDYQVIRTVISPSSSSSVSQVEPNQDLGGWDSIPMPDIVKPSSMTPNESLEEQISSLVANATASAEAQQQQDSNNGQITHRIVYQAVPSSSSSTSMTGNVTTTTTGTSGRSSLYSQQYTPIYQLLQPINSDSIVPSTATTNNQQQIDSSNTNNYSQN